MPLLLLLPLLLYSSFSERGSLLRYTKYDIMWAQWLHSQLARADHSRIIWPLATGKLEWRQQSRGCKNQCESREPCVCFPGS